MNNIPLRMHVNFPALRSKLNHPLTLAYQRVAAGLASADRIEHSDLVLPDAMIRLGWAEHDKPTIDQIRGDYRTWVLATGFRDAIEAVHLFLDRVRQAAAMIALGTRDVVQGDEVEKLLNRDQRKFHKEGLPKKVRLLAEKWGIEIPEKFIANARTHNDARNCLVHRAGRVEPEDFNEGDALVVRWRRIALMATGTEGERELQCPDYVGNEQVGVRLKAVERRFHLGDRVSFSATEFSEIALTLTFISDAVVRHLEDHARDLGLLAVKPGA